MIKNLITIADLLVTTAEEHINNNDVKIQLIFHASRTIESIFSLDFLETQEASQDDANRLSIVYERLKRIINTK